MQPKIPVFIIDTNVIVYNILARVTYADTSSVGDRCLPDGTLEQARAYTELALDWVNELGFIAEPYRPREAVVIWITDSKPYWRSEEYAEYKGTRGTKHDFFWQIYAKVVQKFNPVAIPHYEADDIAALYRRIWDKKRIDSTLGQLFLCTSDTDWMGLISDTTTWVDFGGYAPRVRNMQNFHSHWFEKKLNKETKKVMAHIDCDRASSIPSYIWEWKHIAGDRSDNLPAFSPRHLINLLEPPEQHRLWEKPEMLALAKNRLRQPKPFSFTSTFENLRGLYLLGYQAPVQIIQEDIFPQEELLAAA